MKFLKNIYLPLSPRVVSKITKFNRNRQTRLALHVITFIVIILVLGAESIFSYEDSLQSRRESSGLASSRRQRNSGMKQDSEHLQKPDSPFRVIHSSEREVVLEWVLDDYDLVPVELNNQVYYEIVGDFTSYHNKEGHPRLPYISEIVGIPIDGDIQLSLSNAEKSTKRDILIYPAERLVVKDGKGAIFSGQDGDVSNLQIQTEFYKDNTAYRRRNFSHNALTKGNKAFAADRHFTSFFFNPFLYNAHDRELTIIDKAVITVNITGNTSQRSQGDFGQERNRMRGRSYIDRTGDMFFLNNEHSQNWRKQVEPLGTDKEVNYRDVDTDNGIDEIQFVVDKEGIYKVSYEDIKEHIEKWQRVDVPDTLDDGTPTEPGIWGLNVEWDIDEIDPRFLELSSQYGVTPIHFQGERNGSFDPGDYFEFYGQKNFGETGYSDTYTAENIYTLRLSDNWGARMAVESGGIRETNPRNYILPVSFEQSLHFEEQNTYSSLSTYGRYGGGPNYREDLWFWKTIRAPELSVTPFQLEYPDQSFMRGFEANVCLVGSTDRGTGWGNPDHHARVRINSSFINAARWPGQEEQLFENEKFLSNQLLNHGTNYLYVDMPGDTDAGDMEAIFLDYFRVKYWREYKTDNDYIKFSKPSNRPTGLYQFELENFTNENISVYKINSSIMENVQIEPFSETGEAPYMVTFQDKVVGDDIEYIAVTEDKKLKPKQIRPRYPSNLKNPNNAADYIVVTIRDFLDLDSTQLLKETWESRGYFVEIVDVQNIFDEFNYGVRSADAIKDFFRYAYHNWAMPMTDVLLLGKGIFDERDFSSNRDVNLIPYRRVWTYKLGATPSDNWFACIIGDDIVPDFNISRITAWRKDQIEAVVDKTVHYLENKNYSDLWQSNVTLVAGGKRGDAEDLFAQQNEKIRQRWIPKDYHVRRVYSAPVTVSESYHGDTFDLQDSWNDGTAFIQFMGHGGGRIWADYNLLNNNDIATLNNDNYPFVNSLSCYPSDFSRPGVGSIGENMILTAGRGAIAHFGFTGLGYENEDLLVGYHLNEAVFDRKLGKFGDIISFTKAKSYATIQHSAPRLALVEGAVLFGDPMLKFNLPQDRVDVELNTHYITEGDTLRLTVDMGQDINQARFLIQNTDEINLEVPFDLPVINGIFEVDYVVPEVVADNYERLVKVFGYGDDRQVLGKTRFTVGQAAVIDNISIPEQPTAEDSVYISSQFFDEAGIRDIVCEIKVDIPHEREPLYDSINMIPINEGGLRNSSRSKSMRTRNVGSTVSRSNDNNRYITEHPITPYEPGTFVYYRFIITNNNNQEITTEYFDYNVVGPDLAMTNIELSSWENKPSVEIIIKNKGDHISPPTTVNLYERIGAASTLIADQAVTSIDPLEERKIQIPIPPLRGNLRFRAIINEDEAFQEHVADPFRNNNIITSELYSINMFYAGVSDTTVYSLDNNVKVEFPAHILEEEKIFFITTTPFKEPLNQPDVQQLALTDNEMSPTYRIGMFGSESLGLPERSNTEEDILPGNKKINVTFEYNTDHPPTAELEEQRQFSFYRWEADYSKWIHQGGFIDAENNLVFQEINRLGTYTILHNADTVGPTIRANVQDQEFTFGGYISGNGVISLTLADANGINIFDDDLQLFLNGTLVPEEDYTLAVNPQNLTSVPIKYQLNLDAGNYTLFITCSDVNGNSQSHDINFVVSTDFDVLNLANYPNPVVTNSIDPINANRTRFTYVLTDDADNVKIKIYTVSGRLVKTLENLPTGVGYHEYPRTVLGWDCRDDSGMLLSNGIYFYKIIARQNNQTIERIQKMAITR